MRKSVSKMKKIRRSWVVGRGTVNTPHSYFRGHLRTHTNTHTPRTRAERMHRRYTLLYLHAVEAVKVDEVGHAHGEQDGHHPPPHKPAFPCLHLRACPHHVCRPSGHVIRWCCDVCSLFLKGSAATDTQQKTAARLYGCCEFTRLIHCSFLYLIVSNNTNVTGRQILHSEREGEIHTKKAIRTTFYNADTHAYGSH